MGAAKKLIRKLLQVVSNNEKHEDTFINAVLEGNLPRLRKLFANKMTVFSPIEWESHSSEVVYPIHIACALGSLDVVKLLVNTGCLLETKTDTGLTPLHFVAKYNHIYPEVVSYLVDMGSVVNVEDRLCNMTACHYACISNNFGVVKQLLKCAPGVVFPTNTCGKKTLQLALESSSSQIVALFEEYQKDFEEKTRLSKLAERTSVLESKIESIVHYYQRKSGLVCASDGLLYNKRLACGDDHCTPIFTRQLSHSSPCLPQILVSDCNNYIQPRGELSNTHNTIHSDSYCQQFTHSPESVSCSRYITKDDYKSLPEVQKTLIQRQYSFICSNMKPDYILIKLFAKEHFGLKFKESLSHRDTDYGKNDYLLSQLILKGSLGLFEDFIQSLKDTRQTHIALVITRNL